MKTAVYPALICFCLLVFAGGCRHKKSSVSRAKKSKQQTSVAAHHPVAKQNKNVDPAAVNGNTNLICQKLGVTEKEIRNSRLLSFVGDWYGVPYKYGGCQKTGVDCSCFTNLLYEKVYNKKTARSADEMYQACEKILLNEVREGDLLFFKINGNLVSHVGVYLRNNLFVHASTSKGVIINSVDEAYYKKYFHSGGRLKNS